MSNNFDAVLDILNELNFQKISYDKSKYIFRFARAEGRNPTSIVLNLNTLSYYCFSTNEKGNLYTLIMKKENFAFSDSLNWVAKKLSLDKTKFEGKIQLPFGGFYKGLMKQISEPEYFMKTYDESVLNEFSGKCNKMFLDDGISFDVQQEYRIGYDLTSNRITVPIWTLDNKLCGVMGRLNDRNCASEERWLPLLSCSRSLTIYGYNNNYFKIQEKGLAIVGESEKFPMQMASFDSYIGLSTSGCHISDTQAKYLKALFIPKIILAYDEGLEEDFIKEQATKIQIKNSMFRNKVGYVFDQDNDYLPKGSKMSPTDRGKYIFSELIKHKVRWLK